MGVNKIIHVPGTGAQPQAGQTVIIEYTGWLKDVSQADAKGTQYVGVFPPCNFLPRSLVVPPPSIVALFLNKTACYFRFDSSIGRGDFVTQIGIGRLIRGMDVPTISPLSLFYVSETLCMLTRAWLFLMAHRMG